MLEDRSAELDGKLKASESALAAAEETLSDQKAKADTAIQALPTAGTDFVLTFETLFKVCFRISPFFPF